MKKIIVITSVALGLAVFGCKDEYTAEGTLSVSPIYDKLPPTLIAATQPAGAQDIPAAKKSARDGEAIVVTGKIAGVEDPLADNRAMMTILDASVKTCDSMPGDACKTPWDACCEPSEVRAAKSATVQVVGPDGKPLKATLDGVAGIKPLKTVVVAGIARPAGDALVIEAKQIYVQP